jgi:two-component system, OmpR family, response regulator
MGNDHRNARPAIWTSRRVPRGTSKIRVLVVDDNVSAAQALATYLSLEGMECEAAFGGRAAVTFATEFRPHVIIMDISMPGCNGYQAALALRADARTNEVAIIAFTALDESELHQHVIDQEFDAYYQKGQAPSRLATLVTLFAN